VYEANKAQKPTTEKAKVQTDRQTDATIEQALMQLVLISVSLKIKC